MSNQLQVPKWHKPSKLFIFKKTANNADPPRAGGKTVNQTITDLIDYQPVANWQPRFDVLPTADTMSGASVGIRLYHASGSSKTLLAKSFAK
jgi:hypothetical protein